MRLMFILFAALLFAPAAQAHDIYKGLHEGLVPEGQLCCGGDPVTGDCEAVGTAYEVLPDGSAIFTSERYKRQVHVSKEKITWAFVPTGEFSEAHWCGKPRQSTTSGYAPGSGYGMTAPPDAVQPDPETWTYCAFIAPGGV
jgi:hypothetical protein